MTRTLSTPRITVGRHYHRATIWRLARLLIHKWHIFQRAAHNRKVHPTVQQALKELLQGPLFQICRQHSRGAAAAVVVEHRDNSQDVRVSQPQ